MNKTLEYALFYASYELSIIPLKPGEKLPLIKWEKYQEEPPTMGEVQKWFESGNNNIGIVCGKVSNNLVVIDFDDAEVYEKFMKEIDGDAELKDIVESTWLVKSGKGFHVYLWVDTNKPVKTGKLPKVDIKGEGGYVVAPPSLHPSGKRYEFVRFTKTTGHEIRTISEGRYSKLLTVLEGVTGGKLSLERQQKKEDSGVRRLGKELNDEQIAKIVKALEPVYRVGHRHNIILYLTGWLYTKGVDYNSAEKLVKTICERYQDEECNDRLYTLNDTFGINKEPRDKRAKLKTKGGLYEEITQIVSEGVANSIITAIKNAIEATLRTGVLEERLIESFDTLRIFHDFQHGKAYVSTYKAVIQKVETMMGREVVIQEEKVVKIDKIFINEGGKIKILSDESELENEYLEIDDLDVEVKHYPKLNLPTSIFDNVKIADVFKETLDFVSQRIETARQEDKIAVTIWAIATYFVPIFQYFPFLAPLKLGYNSGGSELLSILKKIAPRPLEVSDLTAANVYRLQEQLQPTLLIDEVRDEGDRDAFNALYRILVAGYKRGVLIPRTEKGTEKQRLFEPFGAKAIIDQSLITSQYDIASRCLFVRLQRNPHRISDYTDSVNRDLLDKLYSIFLLYAPTAYPLYKDMKDSGYTGRYDQVFRPLITIARLIDREDPTLRVEEQLKVVLEDSKSFAEALNIEGDPQKKVANLVVEFIKDSIGEYLEGKTDIIPKPWHLFEGGEGEGEVYIFLSDLRKKITEYAMSLHQKDVAFRYDENGRSAISEREWSTIEPELAKVLNGRQFTALLKKFFPNYVKEHRTKMIFIISRDNWDKLNFQQPPSEPGRGGKKAGFADFSGGLNISQGNAKNSEPLNHPQVLPVFGSDSGSEINIQKNEIENRNSKSNDELSFNSTIRSTDKNTEPGTTDSAQSRLDFGSEIKSQSRNPENSGSKQNSTAQGLTARQQQILDFLKKLSEKTGSMMRLKKLSKDELKLLPELKEREYVNFDNDHVWLTIEGYDYLMSLLKGGTENKSVTSSEDRVAEAYKELRGKQFTLSEFYIILGDEVANAVMKWAEERGLVQRKNVAGEEYIEFL